MFDLIAFDADDTLWHSEDLYASAQDRFAQLLSAYAERETALATLHKTEIENLLPYGYGVKAFVLSMIEAAIELGGSEICSTEVNALIGLGKEMLAAEVRVLEHVEHTLAVLAEKHALMVITKGDLSHQAAKLSDSGLAQYFKYVEIVADKSADVYATILNRQGIAPPRFLMVGNSLRSDIVPVLELGGWGVYVPYSITWAHEQAELPGALRHRCIQIPHLGALGAAVAELGRRQAAQ
jgi:putative hydrolase of the HAD superfamily